MDKHARVRFSLLGVEWSAQKAGEIRDFLGCSSEITVEGRYLDPRSRLNTTLAGWLAIAVFSPRSMLFIDRWMDIRSKIEERISCSRPSAFQRRIHIGSYLFLSVVKHGITRYENRSNP